MYTFETLLHQELGKGPTKEELCKSIQRILERVLKVRHGQRSPDTIPEALVLRCLGALGLGPTLPPARGAPDPASLLRPSLQKYDYDSSSVRKRFFREALLQITIPFLLKKLAPTCKSVSESLPALAPQGPARGEASDPSPPASLAGAATLPGADLRGLCQVHPGGKHIRRGGAADSHEGHPAG